MTQSKIIHSIYLTYYFFSVHFVNSAKLIPFKFSKRINRSYIFGGKHFRCNQIDKKDLWIISSNCNGIKNQCEFIKVQVFWKGYKNWKKSPTCFDVTEENVKKSERFFSNFVAFSQYLNFMTLVPVWIRPQVIKGVGHHWRSTLLIQNLL